VLGVDEPVRNPTNTQQTFHLLMHPGTTQVCRSALSADVIVLARYRVIGVGALAVSADAVNGDIDRCTDLAHPLIA
jgi:hypothetical protein